MINGSFATIFVATAIAASVACGSAAAADFDAANATYEFAGDTFTLANGKTQIMGHSGLPDASDTPIPIGYTLAARASGSMDGGSGTVAALYRSFGANLQWVVLFSFEKRGAGFVQTASSAISTEEARVDSLSLAGGIVTVKLLVISESDKQLPHYQQKPTEPLTLDLKIENGTFVGRQ